MISHLFWRIICPHHRSSYANMLPLHARHLLVICLLLSIFHFSLSEGNAGLKVFNNTNEVASVSLRL